LRKTNRKEVLQRKTFRESITAVPDTYCPWLSHGA
jgi:hypothetical protein